MRNSIKPTKKVSDAIVEHIERLILEGGLVPGQRLLAERELSAKLGVSRPSLRVALDRLLGMSLLTTDAQGASYVNEALGSSFRDPLVGLLDDPRARSDYLEFRSIIEGAAASYAAERASDIDLQKISRQFGRMQDAHARDDGNEHASADADFHLAIYEASHNLVVLQIMRSLESMLRSDVYLNRKRLTEYWGERDSMLEQHRVIYDAIMARDAPAARDAAERHVTHMLDTLRQMHEEERRAEASIHRMMGSDLVAPAKQ